MKKSISSRLKELMRERNLKQVDILNKTLPFQTKYNVRLAKNDLSQYVNGKVEPNQERVYILAKALDVSEAWLLGYDVPKQRISKDDKSITTIYNQLEEPRQTRVYNFACNQLDEQNDQKVHVYGQTAAGHALEYDQSTVEEEQVSYISKGTDGALNVRGDSMEPLFHDGDLLFFQKVDMVENGEIAVVEINGEAVTTKKVKFDYDNHKIILQSLNDKYNDMIYDSDNARIIGKVLNK